MIVDNLPRYAMLHSALSPQKRSDKVAVVWLFSLA